MDSKIPAGICTPRPLRCPMMPDLEEIPRLRKVLSLTQTALARLASVSQSTIVKIEKRQMNPSYDVVRRIMNSLQAELKKQEKKALVDKIQTRKVQYLEARLPLQTAVGEMQHWKFSQMPVMHNGHPVGSISDKVINNLILSGRDPKDLARIRVDEVMEPAVLVTTRGEVTGIVTKSDLMKLL